MKITYLGHSSFLIQVNGREILVDPYVSQNKLASHISIDDLKPNYILVTHGHEDHMFDVESIALRCGSTIISNFEIVTWFEQKGLNGRAMNLGGKISLDFGTVKYVNATHSSVLPDGTYAGNPGGFVIWDSKSCLYIAGDSALSLDMKLIPMTCPPLKVAILPVGDTFTMGVEDAFVASNFLECDRIVGCHFDTFPPIEIDKIKSVKYFEERGKHLNLLDIGSTIEV